MASGPNSRTAPTPPPPPPGGEVGDGDPRCQFMPLVVDELDGPAGGPRSPAFDPSHIRGSDRIKPSGTTRSSVVGGTAARASSGLGASMITNIGPLEQHAASGSYTHACPCCRRYVPGTSPSSVAQAPEQSQQSQQGIEKSASDEDSGLFGSLRLAASTDSSEGGKTAFEIREIVARGWVHKKGTGKDWLGSRSWKPRWAVLATAAVPGYDVDVPLLLVYWYSSSESPSNVIVLDRTVVMPVDRYKTDKKLLEWNTFTFEVVHTAKKQGGGSNSAGGGDKAEDQENKVTRTFSVPEKERNEWVFNINTALLDYEKRLTKHRNDLAVKGAIQQRRSPPTVGHDESMPGPASPLSPGRRPIGGRGAVHPASPPTSPRASPRGLGGSGRMLKPPLSPRAMPGMLKPPLSPRSSPKGSARSTAAMQSMTPLSPKMARGLVGRATREKSIRAAEAAARDAVRVEHSLNYSASVALDDDVLAGLNINLLED